MDPPELACVRRARARARPARARGRLASWNQSEQETSSAGLQHSMFSHTRHAAATCERAGLRHVDYAKKEFADFRHIELLALGWRGCAARGLGQGGRGVTARALRAHSAGGWGSVGGAVTAGSVAGV